MMFRNNVLYQNELCCVLQAEVNNVAHWSFGSLFSNDVHTTSIWTGDFCICDDSIFLPIEFNGTQKDVVYLAIMPLINMQQCALYGTCNKLMTDLFVMIFLWWLQNYSTRSLIKIERKLLQDNDDQ